MMAKSTRDPTNAARFPTRAAIVPSVVTFLVLGACALLWIPQLLVDHWLANQTVDTSTIRLSLGAATQVVLFSLGGLIGLVGVGLSLSRHRLELDDSQHARKKEDRRIAELAEQRNVDAERELRTRFTQAVTLLSDPDKPTTRQAGVYALGALADDWTNYGRVDERQVCIDVLCGYLRARWDPKSEDADDERRIRAAAFSLIAEHHRPESDRPSWDGAHFNIRNAIVDFDVDFSVVTVSASHIDLSESTFSGHTTKFDGANFSGGIVDFTGAVFSGGVVQFMVARFSEGEVSFKDAEFSGSTVDFAGVDFAGGTVWFTGAVFSGGAVLFGHGAFSGGKVAFGKAQFSGGFVDFSDAKFSDATVQFDRSRFSAGTVHFLRAQFLSARELAYGGASGGGVTFDEARFVGGVVDFSVAKFVGGLVRFEDAQFSAGTVRFDEAQFTAGSVLFARAQLAGGTIRFNGAHFAGGYRFLFDFSGAYWYYYESNPPISVWFNRARFVGTTVRFDGAQFLGGTVVIDESQYDSLPIQMPVS
jgi:uncharacterized protein YjbI with pentapeptide repeats